MFYTSGYKFESNGTMKWMGNNKPLTYTNWAAGQPNNALGLDKCIHLHESVSNDGHLPFTWNDICCVAELNFICEKLPEYDNNGKRKIEFNENACKCRKLSITFSN